MRAKDYGLLITHKSMRSQNPVTWWELHVRTNSRDLVVLQIKCSQLGTAIQTVDWSHVVVVKHQVLQLTEISTIQGFNFVVLLWDRNEHSCAGILFAFTNTCNTTLNRPADLFFSKMAALQFCFKENCAPETTCIPRLRKHSSFCDFADNDWGISKWQNKNNTLENRWTQWRQT